MNYTIMPYQERLKLRESDKFRGTNAAFNYKGENRPARCGYLMKLIRELQPSSPDDFVDKYLKWRKDNIDEDYLLANNIEDFMKITGYDFNLSFNILLIYLCDNTWKGYFNEQKAIRGIYNYLMEHSADKSGWRVVHASSEIDVHYAIDVLIYHNHKLCCGIQLKPESFFSDSRRMYKDDLIRNINKIKEFEHDYGVSAGFWTYEDIKSGIKARRV